MNTAVRFKAAAIAALVVVAVLSGCGGKDAKDKSVPAASQTDTAETSAAAAVEADGALAKFVPAGYRIFEAAKGDLNKDGLEDYVLTIKGTDRANFTPKKHFDADDAEDEASSNDEKFDCNRGGIVVVFNRGDSGYELALENRGCLPSCDDDDPGRVFVDDGLYARAVIANGNLIIAYDYVRYSHSKFTFRYQNSDFELIGYDDLRRDRAFNYGMNISVNLITKKMRTKTLLISEEEYADLPCNEKAEDGNEKNDCDEKAFVEEKWRNITLKKPIKLRYIKDIGASMTDYIKELD